MSVHFAFFFPTNSDSGSGFIIFAPRWNSTVFTNVAHRDHMKCRHDETDNDNHQSYSSDRVKLKSSGAYYLGVSAKSPPRFWRRPAAGGIFLNLFSTNSSSWWKINCKMIKNKHVSNGSWTITLENGDQYHFVLKSARRAKKNWAKNGETGESHY